MVSLDCTKKLRTMGSSYGVVIPSNLLKEMGLKQGDKVVLYYDDVKKEVIIKKNMKEDL